MQGVVKFYNAKSGFGFITGENGVDYFVPYANITMENETDFKKVHRNANVTFDPSDTDKGPMAVNVVELKPEPAA